MQWASSTTNTDTPASRSAARTSARASCSGARNTNSRSPAPRRRKIVAALVVGDRGVELSGLAHPLGGQALDLVALERHQRRDHHGGARHRRGHHLVDRRLAVARGHDGQHVPTVDGRPGRPLLPRVQPLQRQAVPGDVVEPSSPPQLPQDRAEAGRLRTTRPSCVSHGPPITPRPRPPTGPQETRDRSPRCVAVRTRSVYRPSPNVMPARPLSGRRRCSPAVAAPPTARAAKTVACTRCEMP